MFLLRGVKKSCTSLLNQGEAQALGYTKRGAYAAYGTLPGS